MLQRDQVPAQDTPAQTLTVAELGGDVIVRGLDMPGLLRYAAERERLSEPLPGESEQDARERAGAALIPVLLSATVVLEDGLPVYTAGQWGAFGAKHPGAAMRLWRAAQGASGTDAEAEKKS